MVFCLCFGVFVGLLFPFFQCLNVLFSRLIGGRFNKLLLILVYITQLKRSVNKRNNTHTQTHTDRHTTTQHNTNTHTQTEEGGGEGKGEREGQPTDRQTEEQPPPQPPPQPDTHTQPTTTRKTPKNRTGNFENNTPTPKKQITFLYWTSIVSPIITLNPQTSKKILYLCKKLEL